MILALPMRNKDPQRPSDSSHKIGAAATSYSLSCSYTRKHTKLVTTDLPGNDGWRSRLSFLKLQNVLLGNENVSIETLPGQMSGSHCLLVRQHQTTCFRYNILPAAIPAPTPANHPTVTPRNPPPSPPSHLCPGVRLRASLFISPLFFICSPAPSQHCRKVTKQRSLLISHGLENGRASIAHRLRRVSSSKAVKGKIQKKRLFLSWSS